MPDTVTPSRRVRRTWLIVGSLVTVPVLLYGGTQVASALAHEERTEVAEFDAGDLRRVDVDNAAGSVRIVGVEDADTVSVTARISDGWRATGHDVRREGDRLVIEGTCPMFLSDWCNVRYTIEMPSDLDVAAETDTGGVTVTDIAGDVEASSDHGRIELARIEGDVVLHSDNGSVTATGIRRASRAAATSDNGGVRLEFLDPPDDVVATSDNGSVDVVIPDDGAIAYKVDAESDNGTVSFPVRTDPDGERTITAQSDNGDVTITYALR
jgi:Putative adhesin